MPDDDDQARDQALDELARRFHAGESQPASGESPAAAALDVDEVLEAEVPDDDLRGTLLARRLSRRRGYGLPAREAKVRNLFGNWALLALAALSAWSFASALPDIRYWLSSAKPLDLGHLGGYSDPSSLSGAADGAYVHLEGVASPKRGTYSRFLREHEVFPLLASRFLIDRPGTPNDSLRGYGFRYSGDGRLWRASSESRFAGVREQFVKAGELAAVGEVYVIEDGVAPRRGFGAPLEFVLWGGLCTLCLAVVVRRKLRR